MVRRRSTRKLATSLTAIALSLFALSPSVLGAVTANCNYRDTIFNGEVDFGSGDHSFGNPATNGIVTWTFTSVNGALVVTARVLGTLYLDKLGSGCAGLKINFQDSAGNNLQNTQIRSFCGPGFDADAASNQRAIDVTSVANGQLGNVQLTLGSGNTSTTIIDRHTGSVRAPSRTQRFWDRINNGNTDFGFNSHSGGGPASDALIELSLLNDGRVSGFVNGVLYWDDLFGGGTSRLVTDFQNSNGTTLVTRTNEITGTGGNANDAVNKTLVFQRVNNASLFKIRLRVGRVSNGSFVNVVSRTYSFGCR